nr:HipA domain-containing protein [Lachnospiraceae bacterium]
MIRCLCCNKEIANPGEYEKTVLWHQKCIKAFFGTEMLPQIDCSEKELERLANQAVNKGLTVPGVQKKLSLHLENEDRTAKLTIVDHPTGYILKPQSYDFSCLPEAEYMSMKMAEAANIRTVPNALIRVDGSYAYITRRIDRKNDRVLAMEDFCQLSGRMTADKYRSSYENCGKVIKRYSKNVGIDE